MADIADLAQINEERERDSALNAQQNQPRVAQLKKRGLIVCLDCVRPLSNKRLDANPRAVRCFYCQQEHEREQAIRSRR